VAEGATRARGVCALTFIYSAPRASVAASQPLRRRSRSPNRSALNYAPRSVRHQFVLAVDGRLAKQRAPLTGCTSAARLKLPPRPPRPWGEPAIKMFVREALDEALKLESALARLRMPNRIALLHYSPIQATVEGEPLEIYPFLGSSCLEKPINRYQLDAVLHGHAHHGAPEGRTSAQVPSITSRCRCSSATSRIAPPFGLSKWNAKRQPQPTQRRRARRSLIALG
jgi:hypothetical protein